MIELPIFLGYALFALYTAWRFAGWYAWHCAEADRIHRKHADNFTWVPSGDIWFGGYFLGIFAGAAWPIVVLFMAFRKLHKCHSLNYTPKDQRIKMLQDRIKQMDRELGLD